MLLSSSPADSEFLSDSAAQRINFRVARLGCKFCLSRADQKDLRQDFWMILIRAARRYDPTRCPLDRYITMVLNVRYKFHVREFKHARKAQVINAISLEDVGEQITAFIVDPAAELTLAQIDTALDVQHVLQTLPAQDKHICQMVMTSKSPYEAAQRLGVFPSAVYRTLKRLRPVFAQIAPTAVL